MHMCKVARSLGAPVLVAAIVGGLNGCSIPKPTALVCRDGQSIFACEAEFSDGTPRGLGFVDAPPKGAVAIDAVTTRDDFGNVYCITLYEDVTATYESGEC